MEFTCKEAKELLFSISDMFEEKKEELSEYDAVIGDGDHGFSMARGAKAAKTAVEALEDNVSINDCFKAYSRALIKEIGGAIGPIFGLFFAEMGKATLSTETFGLKEFSCGLNNATKKIMDFGGAKLGDKTMVDAMVPASESVQNAEDKSLAEVTEIATSNAYQGLQDTIPLTAKRGRSRFLQEKSVGHQDAGATSFYYILKTIHNFVISKGL